MTSQGSGRGMGGGGNSNPRPGGAGRGRGNTNQQQSSQGGNRRDFASAAAAAGSPGAGSPVQPPSPLDANAPHHHHHGGNSFYPQHGSNSFRSKGKWSNGPPGQNHHRDRQDVKPAPAAQSEQMDRLWFLMMNLVGTKVLADLKDGTQFEGIFHTASTSPDLGVVLKMAQQIVEGKPFGQTYNDLVITPKDLMTVSAKSVVIDTSISSVERGDKSGFATDAAIGAKVGEFGKERELLRWTPSASEALALGSLEDEKSDGKWDQFSTNERLFGVTTDFQEELYTTSIDRSAPDYKKKEAEAFRIAREIENDSRLADNIHIMEERNNVIAADEDEEEKYSSVIRQPGKYVPPGARAAQKSMGGALPPRKRPESLAAQSTTSPATVSTPEAKASSPASPIVPAGEKVQNPILAAISTQHTSTPTGTASAPHSAAATTPSLPERMASTPSAPSAAEKLSKPATPSVVETTSVGSLPGFDTNHAKSLDRDGARKGELLTKLPFKEKPSLAGEPVALKDPSQMIGDALQDFRSFAIQERKQIPQKIRDLKKQEKSSLINELKNFSKEFKLNTPIPADLCQILKKEKDPSKPSGNVKTDKPDSTSAENRSKVDNAKQTKIAPPKTGAAGKTKERSSSDVAPPSASPVPSEALSATPGDPATDAASTTSTTTETTKTAASKFKFSVSAVEFKPSGASSSSPTGNANMGPQPTKSPGHGDKRPASVAGSSKGASGSRSGNNYNKGGFQKNGGQAAAKPGAGAPPQWAFGQQHYRPVPFPPYEEGSVYMGPVDPNQQLYYPVPGPYPQFARVPMVPRPYMAGMPPAMMAPGSVPMYPYVQQFPGGVPPPTAFTPPMMPMPGPNQPGMPVYRPQGPPPPGTNPNGGKGGAAGGNGNHGSQPNQPGMPVYRPGQEHYPAGGPPRAGYMPSPPPPGPPPHQVYHPAPMMPGYPMPEFYPGGQIMMAQVIPGVWPPAEPIAMEGHPPNGVPHQHGGPSHHVPPHPHSAPLPQPPSSQPPGPSMHPHQPPHASPAPTPVEAGTPASK
ncbi:hypothetical protein HDU76_013666 [Blyttiomyces sp. JEL0837]|nr:hypothetical protein HDU76_013666 [Blyttiomyces sp. JEL0837]